LATSQVNSGHMLTLSQGSCTATAVMVCASMQRVPSYGGATAIDSFWVRCPEAAPT
jgi:hypothetical protein